MVNGWTAQRSRLHIPDFAVWDVRSFRTCQLLEPPMGMTVQNGQMRGITSMDTTKVTRVSPAPTRTKSMKVYRPGP